LERQRNSATGELRADPDWYRDRDRWVAADFQEHDIPFPSRSSCSRDGPATIPPNRRTHMRELAMSGPQLRNSPNHRRYGTVVNFVPSALPRCRRPGALLAISVGQARPTVAGFLITGCQIHTVVYSDAGCRGSFDRALPKWRPPPDAIKDVPYLVPSMGKLECFQLVMYWIS
jgi:hypothetical protein